MHTSACVSCVRACTNRNEKEKADSLVIFPFFVFDGLSMSFHLHIPVHPSASQCHPVPSGTAPSFSSSLSPSSIVATAWSDLVATSMRSTSCNAFQIVPSPGTVGIVLKSWFVLCLFCVSLWMCFGFFLACFR